MIELQNQFANIAYTPIAIPSKKGVTFSHTSSKIYYLNKTQIETPLLSVNSSTHFDRARETN